MSNVLMTGCEV